MARISEPRPGEPITIFTRQDGSIRYRAVADVGTARKRKQQRRSFLTLRDARQWLDEVRTDTRRGVHVARSATSFDKLADTYLRLAANRVRPVTVRGYTESLLHARAAFGPYPRRRSPVTTSSLSLTIWPPADCR
jgi:hypothetical protein